MSYNLPLEFQDPSSGAMSMIIDFHNNIHFWLIVILVVVSFFLRLIVAEFGSIIYETSVSADNSTLLQSYGLIKRLREISVTRHSHAVDVEIIWTILPALILITIAIPSVNLLYSLENISNDAPLTLKVIGHQWYWEYELVDPLTGVEEKFESYMLPEDDLAWGQSRLVEVDNAVYLPLNTPVRIIATSVDVIHSWALPSLGVKIDCIPGRLNTVFVTPTRLGSFYGQCSELCGANHGFMPSKVVITNESLFLNSRLADDLTQSSLFGDSK